MKGKLRFMHGQNRQFRRAGPLWILERLPACNFLYYSQNQNDFLPCMFIFLVAQCPRGLLRPHVTGGFHLLLKGKVT